MPTDPTTERKGDWIQTFTALKFWPLDPRLEDICIEDIAHALSNTCRYGGHCKEFYSVAQHSVEVARLCCRVGKQEGLWGLLHDAPEAYLADLPRPVKRGLREAGVTAFDEAEALLMTAVCARFGLPVEAPPCVKEADTVLLATEARSMMPINLNDWGSLVGITPLDHDIHPLPPKTAKLMFLTTFRLLQEES